MDCDHCQQLLLDLACGEPLASGEARDVRTHAATCSTCEPSLRKLERALRLAAELPLVEPSEKATARIMQLARNHALTTRTLAHAPVSAAAKEEQPSLADRLRVFLSQFAMGRQVAMATVMVLVTAVGFWFVPRAHQHDLAGGNVVNPDPEGEAGPSKGIVPAAPLDLDLRQGRIRTRGYEYEQRGEREDSAGNATLSTAESTPAPELAEQDIAPPIEAPLAALPAAPDELATQPAAEAIDDALAGLDDAREEKAQGRSEGASTRGSLSLENHEVAPSRSAAPKMAPATIDDSYAMADSAPSVAPAPQASVRASSAAESEGFSPAPSASASGGGMGVARRSQAVAPIAAERPTAPTDSGSDALTLATENFRTGNYRAAIDGFEAVRQTRGGQLPASARLSLARSYDRTARCDLAVSQYELFLRANPRSAEVMQELANCYRQLGRAEDAARWTATARDVQYTNKSSVKKVESVAPTQAQ